LLTFTNRTTTKTVSAAEAAHSSERRKVIGDA
jgi:hypothetical protein